jgi:hypothetical protein
MLATLPASDSILEEEALTSQARESIGAIVIAIYSCSADVLALKTMGTAIIAGAIIALVQLGLWEAILITAVFPFLILLGKLKRWRRLRGAQKAIVPFHQEPDFNCRTCKDYVGKLDWSVMSHAEKEELLAMFSIIKKRGTENDV